jgi:hypothetical protein
MKKEILSIAIVAFLCLGLTSCDKDTPKCYKFTYKVEIADKQKEISTFEWCSANEADAKKEALEKNLGVKVSRTIAKSHKTVEDCIAANLEK